MKPAIGRYNVVSTDNDTFSWDLSQNRIFVVTRDGAGEWIPGRAIAWFSRDSESALLLDTAIEALKRAGWSWVEPEAIQ